MRQRDLQEANRLFAALEAFEAEQAVPLPGLPDQTVRDVFVEQLLESERRARYYEHLATSDLSPRRADPGSGIFDPLKAAVLQHRDAHLEEACWLVFLSVHFGRHRTGGWGYVTAIYGRLGQGGRWDFTNTSAAPNSFRDWLSDHSETIHDLGGGFGNHRKYESLAGWSANGTGAVVASYIEWIMAIGSHAALFDHAAAVDSGEPTAAFDYIFDSMDEVDRFGRTARFDYLTALQHLGIAGVRPGKAYIIGSTGPRRGATLLFGDVTGPVLETRTVELGKALDVGYDVLEDALCNWQKSPNEFKPFRG